MTPEERANCIGSSPRTRRYFQLRWFLSPAFTLFSAHAEVFP
ncbi:Uncharacterised protein [Corynebacterium striatum]|nr:Uncharacterised protein [Corynebacterium striatum]